MTQQHTSGRGLTATIAAVAVTLLASCGGGSTTSPTPTATPTPVTETFNGTLDPAGSTVFPFTVAAQSTLTATLTTLSPQTTITVGFGIGQPASGVCTLISGGYTETAKVGQVLSGTIVPGSYCVVVYDIGNVQVTNDFVITVVHS
jgi:hypothetical protein